MFPAVATRVWRQRTVAAAALSAALLLGPALAGCEYADEDGHGDDDAPTASAPPPTSPAQPADAAPTPPLTGAELDEWAKQALPAAEGEVFHTGYGSLEPDVERTEPTVQLPSGTYALSLACRSASRVSFTVRDGRTSLVDLSLWCGTSRVNVVTLPADAILTLEVEGDTASNFAYSVARL